MVIGSCGILVIQLEQVSVRLDPRAIDAPPPNGEVVPIVIAPSPGRSFAVIAAYPGAPLVPVLFPKKLWGEAFVSTKDNDGVVPAFVTVVVKIGDKFPALKFVTVPLPPPPEQVCNTTPPNPSDSKHSPATPCVLSRLVGNCPFVFVLILGRFCAKDTAENIKHIVNNRSFFMRRILTHHPPPAVL